MVTTAFATWAALCVALGVAADRWFDRVPVFSMLLQLWGILHLLKD